MGDATKRRRRHAGVVRAVTLSAVLITAGCTNVPYKGPKTGTGLPPNLDASAGQLLRYCQRIRETGDLAAAAGVCERAHRQDPSSPAPLMEIASILTEMGELDLAVTAYKTLLRHTPAYADAQYALGRTYVAQNHYDLALAEFRAVLQARPDDAALYNAVGVVSDLMGAREAAQAAFKKGLNRAPGDARLRNNLGLSLVRSGRYEEGVAVLASLAEEPVADQSTKENLQLALGLAAEARIEMMARAADAEAATEAAATDRSAPAQFATAPTADQERVAVMAAPPAPIETETRKSAPPSPTPLADAFTAMATTEHRALEAGEGGYDFYTETPHSPAAAPPSAGRKADRASVAAARVRQTATAGAADTPVDEADRTTGARARTSSGHAIQFASYTQADDAHRGWDTLRERAPDLLAEIEPRVVDADLGPAAGGVFYRLRTPPTSQAEAKQLCTALAARGIDCLVVRAEPASADAATGAGAATL